MTPLTSNPSVEALAWALIHFLWQGAAIAVVFVLWLRGRPTPQARYVAGIVALAALLLAPVATFALRTSPASVERSGTAVLPLLSPAGAGVPARTETPVAPLTAADLRNGDSAAQAASDRAAVVIVAAWAAGVLLLSLRLASGWILARRLTARGTVPAGDRVAQASAALSRRLGLTRAVRIVESTAVTVPVLVGWLKPVVLMPAAALSGLSPAQIDALIAHELAHVRRHDYLVNILQSLLETLLFYHPAVWIVSREVREAREQCCDDLATGVCDPVVYVSALADLAEMNRAPRMALAATGGSLLGRVQRLLGQPHERSGPGVASLGVLTLALVLGGVLPFAIGSAASTDALDGDARRDVRLHAADEVTEPLERDAPDHPLLERVQQTPPQPDPAVAAPGDMAVGANVQRTVLNCVVHPDGTVSDCEVVRSLASTSGVDEKLVARPADARAVPAASMQASQPPVQTRDPRQQEIVLLLDLLDSSTDTVFRERLLLTWARGQLQLGGEWTNRRVPPPNLIAERAVAGSLVRHAEAGSVDGIAAALASGADVNTRTTTTPLLAAVSGGHVDAVALLLARGADPNRSVAGIGSPLQRAAAAGDTAKVERLLDHGAMVDQIADQGTALIQASARGHLQVVQLLVERGANVDVRVWADPPSDERRGEWRTAVSAARRAGHEDTASYLVSRGAVE